MFGAGRLEEAKWRLGAAKGAGSGGWDRGGLAGSASVLRGCWDFRRATSVWQLHFNMYLKALKISATIKPPLPPAAVHWDPEWAALGPSRLVGGGARGARAGLTGLWVPLRMSLTEGWPLAPQLAAWAQTARGPRGHLQDPRSLRKQSSPGFQKEQDTKARTLLVGGTGWG